MKLFEPVWMTENPQRRDKAVTKVQNLADRNVLARIAREAPLQAVREAAIDRLCDQGVLLDVAMHDLMEELRVRAARRLTDPGLLQRAATESPDEGVRLAAVERLDDQAALLSVAMRDRSASVGKAACKRLTDQSALRRVALDSRYSDLRAAAVEKLDDQAVLHEIALNDRDPAVCEAAVHRLTDQSLLCEVALRASVGSVRAIAAGMLIYKDALREIVMKGDLSACEAAVGHLRDQEALRYLILERNWDDECRAAIPLKVTAIKKLEDRDALRRIAGSSEPALRWEALRKLKDEALLREAALGDDDDYVRLNAAKALGMSQIVDELEARKRLQRLKEVTREYDYGDYRRDLLAVTDRDMLADVYENGKCPAIREYAMKRFLTLCSPMEALQWMEAHGKSTRDYLEKMLTGADSTEGVMAALTYVNYNSYRDVANLPYSKAWKALLALGDTGLYAQLAAEAKTRMVRYYSCKKAGGHLFPSKGKGSNNICRCTRCGFEYHTAQDKNQGQPWTCERCKGILKTEPFTDGSPTTTITYPDGTTFPVANYDGLVYQEEELARKYDLF